MSEPIVIICAPATAERKVRGTKFDNVCSKCGQRVMLAPSGQKLLRANPAATMLCADCFVSQVREGQECEIRLAAEPSEMVAEIIGAIPNDWRQRN